MNMIVSGVNSSGDKKYAYIRFEEGKMWAEGIIPDCKIVKQQGFDEEQVSQLEDYLKANLTQLKKAAAKINPIVAMMK